MALDPDEKRARDIEQFLRKALEIELDDPAKRLTEEELKKIALNCGLSEEDWERLTERLQGHLDKGVNFLEHGNHQDAILELDQAAALAPYRVDVLYPCGEAHQLRWKKTGKNESRQRAKELFSQCLDLQADHEGAASGLSEIRHRDAEKKTSLRRMAAVAAALLAIGGGSAWWTMSRPPALPQPQPTPPADVTDFKIESGDLKVQRSGNVVAVARFSSIKPAFPDSLPGDIVQIEAGFSDNGHILALRENGEVLAWGANSYHQCDVPPLKRVVRVAAGWRHSLALQEDGTVVAWGDDEAGQCHVPEGLNEVVQISAGNKHSIALKSDGTVVAWGANQFGQSDVPPGLGPVAKLAEVCADHTVVITRDGKLAAWGKSDLGETEVPNDSIGDANIVKVWASGENYALLDDGRMLHWGMPLRSDQLPSEMTGVADVFSGFPAAVLIKKTDHTVSVHGAVKDHPDHATEFKDWENVVISPSFFYGLERTKE